MTLMYAAICFMIYLLKFICIRGAEGLLVEKRLEEVVEEEAMRYSLAFIGTEK